MNEIYYEIFLLAEKVDKVIIKIIILYSWQLLRSLFLFLIVWFFFLFLTVENYTSDNRYYFLLYFHSGEFFKVNYKIFLNIFHKFLTFSVRMNYEV